MKSKRPLNYMVLDEEVKAFYPGCVSGIRLRHEKADLEIGVEASVAAYYALASYKGKQNDFTIFYNASASDYRNRFCVKTALKGSVSKRYEDWKVGGGRRGGLFEFCAVDHCERSRLLESGPAFPYRRTRVGLASTAD